MLGKLLTPFTTATASGTVFRDVFIMVGAVITILGALGIVSQEQVAALRAAVTKLSDPAVLAAIGILMAAGMSAYRAVFKSSSNKAADAAKAIDAKLDPEEQVVIKTPAGVPDIVVPGAVSKIAGSRG